jgi:hypothetical protein
MDPVLPSRRIERRPRCPVAAPAGRQYTQGLSNDSDVTARRVDLPAPGSAVDGAVITAPSFGGCP